MDKNLSPDLRNILKTDLGMPQVKDITPSTEPTVPFDVMRASEKFLYKLRTDVGKQEIDLGRALAAMQPDQKSNIDTMPIYQKLKQRRAEINAAEIGIQSGEYDKVIPLAYAQKDKLGKESDALVYKLQTASKEDFDDLQEQKLKLDTELKSIDQLINHFPTQKAPTPPPASEITKLLDTTPPSQPTTKLDPVLAGGFNGQNLTFELTKDLNQEPPPTTPESDLDPEAKEYIQANISARVWQTARGHKLSAYEYMQRAALLEPLLAQEFQLLKGLPKLED